MKPKTSICLAKKIAIAAIAAFAVLPTMATDYYWYSSASGNWRDASNWSTSSSEYVNAEGKFPTSSDNATIATPGLAINIAGGNADVNTLTVSEDVTFSGDQTVTLSSNRKTITGRSVVAQTITGVGVLTLNNVFLRSNSAALTVDNDVVVSGAAGFYANDKYTVTMNGDVSGSGLLVLYQYGNDDGTTFSGDNSGFSGEVRFGQRNDYSRDRTKFASTTASFSGAAWYPKSINKYDYNNPHFPSSGTYGIGSLFGWLNVGEGTDGVVLEIGSLNEDCSAQVNMGASTGGHTGYSTIRKVGTGTFEFSLLKSENGTPVIGDLEVVGGTLKVVPGSYTQVLPNSGHYISFKGAGATLDLPEGTDPSAKIRNSTSAIRVSEGNANATWTTALDSSNTGGLVKLGSGTLELTAVPEYTGATIVSAGTLVVPGGTTLDNLDSIAEGASLVVNVDDGETLTIKSFGEGLSTASITIPVGSSVAWAQDGETGYWTGTFTRGALTYTWTDAASGDHDWTTPGNWSVGGVAATFPPQETDTVVFPVENMPEGGWNVSMDANKTVAAVRFNGATALSGALIVCSDVTAASGNVNVTLGNNAGFQENVAALTLADMSFDIAAAEETPARFYFNTGSAFKIESTCAITGTGAVSFGVERDSTGLEIKADMTEFAGKATITNARVSAYRSNTSIVQQATSSNAVWQVNNGSKDKAFFNNGGVTYYFGSLSGSISHNYASVNSTSAGFGYRIEVGHLGLDDTLGGRFFSSTYAGRLAEAKYQPILRKVGGGTLTFTGLEIARYEINGGVLYCKADSAFDTSWTGGAWHTPITFGGDGGTLKLDEAVTLDLATNFVNSTKPISIDDGGTNRTWTGVIAASNVGGLTKKGAGTLTLADVPQYTGLTTVEAGALVVPAGSDIVYNPFSEGTLSGVTPVKFAYPAGTTLTGAETENTFVGSLDISNVAAINVSAATLTKGQPYVIASATTITGYTKAGLAELPLTLPDGADVEKWVAKVLMIGGNRCLCVAPKVNPFMIIVR